MKERVEKMVNKKSNLLFQTSHSLPNLTSQCLLKLIVLLMLLKRNQHSIMQLKLQQVVIVLLIAWKLKCIGHLKILIINYKLIVELTILLIYYRWKVQHQMLISNNSHHYSHPRFQFQFNYSNNNNKFKEKNLKYPVSYLKYNKLVKTSFTNHKMHSSKPKHHSK